MVADRSNRLLSESTVPVNTVQEPWHGIRVCVSLLTTVMTKIAQSFLSRAYIGSLILNESFSLHDSLFCSVLIRLKVRKLIKLCLIVFLGRSCTFLSIFKVKPPFGIPAAICITQASFLILNVSLELSSSFLGLPKLADNAPLISLPQD